MPDAQREAPRDHKTKLRWTFFTKVAIILLFLTPIFFAVHPLASVTPDNSSFVILLRHGDAPGQGEPDKFDLNDCSTQRNLSDRGRHDATAIGEKLRARGINVTKVLTSRWCRTRETAALMKLAPVENAPAFDDLSFNKGRAKELLESEHRIIASWRGPGVLLIVSHGSNIKALTGVDLEQGAMIVVRPELGLLHTTPFVASDSFSGKTE